MDPNQQPNPTPQPQQPPHPAAQPVFAQPPASFEPSPQPVQPLQPLQQVQPSPQSLPAPAPPSAYAEAPPLAYDPNYLDSIAPPPPRAKFFSGSFGKIFFIMIGVFVLAVSLIIAFSGKDKTADLQQTQVRVTNFALLTKTQQKDLKSNKLSSTNSSFHLLLENAETDGEKLLGQAGVKKTQYDKKMVASEKALTDGLTKKFTDARLNAALDRTYANSMAAETAKLIGLFQTMSKKSGAKAIRDYAAKLATNLDSIQKSFDEYVDDGN